MRLTFIIYLFSLTSSAVFSQTAKADTTQIIADLCERLKKDQSNYNDTAIRHAIFTDNFQTLLNITTSYGFPTQKLGRTLEERICIGSFTRMTLIHILQSRPLMITDTNVVTLFLREINSGRLDRKVLEDHFFILYNGSTKLCKDYKDKIENAFKIWGLKPVDEQYYLTCH
jgi:hypothetical protein